MTPEAMVARISGAHPRYRSATDSGYDGRSMKRRQTERFQVWLPVKVDQLREGIAVTHDASSRGMLIVSASTLEPGSPVEISLKTPEDPTPRRLTGTVVRVEDNSEDPHGLWPHRLAVEFDEPQPDLEWVVGSERTPDRRTRGRDASD